MNISLTPQLEDYVQQKLATGRYNNASEVVRLLMVREEAKMLWLRDAIQQGIDSGVAEDWKGAGPIIKQAQARRTTRKS